MLSKNKYVSILKKYLKIKINVKCDLPKLNKRGFEFVEELYCLLVLVKKITAQEKRLPIFINFE